MTFAHVYIDESGTHDGSPIMTLAGYVFRSEQAGRFTRDWSKDLGAFGLPYAHMADCTCGSGHYKHLDEDERINSEKKLISHIKRRTVFGFGVSLDPNRYAEVVGGDPRAPSAYSFCMHGCLSIIRRWIESRDAAAKVAYFFEAGHQHQWEANAYMDALSKDADAVPKWGYVSHSFVDKREAAPLQAADMLAWQYQHWLRRKIEGHDKPRADFVALIRRKIDRCVDYTDAELADFRRVYLEGKPSTLPMQQG